MASFALAGTVCGVRGQFNCSVCQHGGWPEPGRFYVAARNWVHEMRGVDASTLSEYFTGDEAAFATARRTVSAAPAATSLQQPLQPGQHEPWTSRIRRSAGAGAAPGGSSSSSSAVTMEAVTAAIGAALSPLQTRMEKLERALDGEALEKEEIPAGASGLQLFGSGELQSLTTGQREKLSALIGSVPGRLNDPSGISSALAARSSSNTLGGGQQVAGTGVVRDRAVDPGASADPTSLAAMLQQQMEMNRFLMERLDNQKPRSSDPLGPLVAGSVGLDEVGSNLLGARGCASRQLVLDQMESSPGGTVGTVRQNLAKCRRIPVEDLAPKDMECHFREDVPFGTHSCLTYYGFLIARMWAIAEKSQAATPGSAEQKRLQQELHAKLGLACVFTEQVAISGGSKFKLAWLLTGEEDPPFAIVRDHRAQPNQQSTRTNRLCDPRWLTANLACMEDLAKLEERADKAEKGGGKGEREKEKEKDKQ